MKLKKKNYICLLTTIMQYETKKKYLGLKSNDDDIVHPSHYL